MATTRSKLQPAPSKIKIRKVVGTSFKTNDSKYPSEFYEFMPQTNKYKLTFKPPINGMNSVELWFAKKMRPDALDIKSMSEICPAFECPQYIKSVMESPKATKIDLFNRAGIQLARSLALMYDKPIIHRVDKTKIGVIEISCVNFGDKCSFRCTFNYKPKTNTLDLQTSEVNETCCCKTSFGDNNFLKYLCYKTMVNLQNLIEVLPKRNHEVVLGITKAYFKSYDITTTEEQSKKWKTDVDNRYFYKPVESADTESIKPPLLGLFDDKLALLESNLLKMIEDEATDYEVIMNDSGTSTGLMIFNTKALAVFNKYGFCATHIKHHRESSKGKFSSTVFNGSLSNHRVQCLSVLISSEEDQSDLKKFVQASLYKLGNPLGQVPKSILDVGSGLERPSKIAFLSDHKTKTLQCFKDLGYENSFVNPEILVALAKLLLSEPLSKEETDALLPFKFDKTASEYIEDVASFNLLTCYEDFAVQFDKWYELDQKNHVLFSFTDLPLPFKKLAEEKVLVETIAKRAFVKEEFKLESLIIKHKKTRNITEYITTLCQLFHLCQSEKGSKSMDFLVRYVFSDTYANTSSWFTVNLIAQANANPAGKLNSKYCEFTNLGKTKLGLLVKDDFGISENKHDQILSKATLFDGESTTNKNLGYLEALQMKFFARLEKHAVRPLKIMRNANYSRFKDHYQALFPEEVDACGSAFGSVMDHFDEISLHIESLSSDFLQILKTMIQNSVEVFCTNFSSGYIDEKLPLIKSLFSIEDKAAFVGLVHQSIANVDIGDHNSVKNVSADVVCKFFHSYLSNSLESKSCLSRKFECIHDLLNRIDICFNDNFSFKVVKPYTKGDISPAYKYHGWTKDVFQEQDLSSLKAKAKNSVKELFQNQMVVELVESQLEPPPKKLKLKSFDPTPDVAFIKRSAAKDDLTTKPSAEINRLLSGMDDADDVAAILEKTFHQTKFGLLTPVISEKRTLTATCEKFMKANPDSAVTFALKPLSSRSTSGKSLWLNDSCIAEFMKVIEEENRDDNVVFLNSMVYNTLRKESYTKKSAENMKMLKEAQIVYCTINVNENHWIVGCIDKRTQSIVMVDSMKSTPKTTLVDEARTFFNKVHKYMEIDNANHHKYKMYKLKSPEQKNNHDCGVFALMTIYQLSKNHLLLLDQTDVPNFRYFIKSSIVKRNNIYFDM